MVCCKLEGRPTQIVWVATNIGVHFRHVALYFGALQTQMMCTGSSETKAGGYLEYERARVRWFLSIDAK